VATPRNFKKMRAESYIGVVRGIDGDLAEIEYLQNNERLKRKITFKDFDPDLKVGDLVEVLTITKKLERALEEIFPD